MKVANIWFEKGSGMVGMNQEKLVRNPEDLNDSYDLMVLHGGEDISPSIYGQTSVHAHVSDTPSLRDRVELAFIEKAIENGVPIFGICRGAQLLCAYSGGTLFQHVEKHHNDHEIITNSGEIFYTNSAHHQAMRLDKEAVLLARTPTVVSKHRWADDKMSVVTDEPEVEAAWWPKLNAVGVQGHPEWLSSQTLFVKFCKHIIKEYLRVSLGV